VLFLPRERADDAPKRATESDFSFLERCSWPAAERVRRFIDDCLANYSEAERPELIARIRSGDERAFRSATFELFLHEYLIRKGFLLTPHPELPGGVAARPDFLVTCPDGSQLYLEAVSATDRDGRRRTGEALLDTTLQRLNDATHPNFFVKIESDGYPTSQPSGRRLTEEVLTWLNGLDADAAISAMEQQEFDRLPMMEWAHEELVLKITAIPCRVDARGQPRRLIGMQGSGARWVDGWTPIRDAVTEKARRYGTLDLPLIVAVNVNSHRLSQIDEMQALFGQEQLVFQRDNIEAEPRMERIGNGAWVGPTGPRSRRCSGAWLFHDVSPYTIGQRRHTLYANPWALHPVPGSLLLSEPRGVVVNDRLERSDGDSLRTILELPDGWPQ
jgi:hypothetical protein